MADKKQETIYDILQNAKSVEFLTAAKNNNIPAVYIIFEDMNTAMALYHEVIRVNKLKEQYFGFKKASSSMILSFIIKDTGVHHAKMLLDYNEQDFDEFIKEVSPTTQYVVLFGQYHEGVRGAAGFPKSEEGFLTFDKYEY